MEPRQFSSNEVHELRQNLVHATLQLQKMEDNVLLMRWNEMLYQSLQTTISERDDARFKLQRSFNMVDAHRGCQIEEASDMATPLSTAYPRVGNQRAKSADLTGSVDRSHAFPPMPLPSPYPIFSAEGGSGVHVVVDVDNGSSTTVPPEGGSGVPECCCEVDGVSALHDSHGGELGQDFVIDQLAMGKPMPENGRFLDAVVDAGVELRKLAVTRPLFRGQIPLFS